MLLKMRIGDFFVFPYDIRHVVYPMTNKKAKRRTSGRVMCDVHPTIQLVQGRLNDL